MQLFKILYNVLGEKKKKKKKKKDDERIQIALDFCHSARKRRIIES